MKGLRAVGLLALCGLVAFVAGPTATELATTAAQVRKVAVTIDDLPYVNPAGGPFLASAQRATTAILEALRKHGVPAVAFVNERTLDAASDRAAARRLLEQWVEAGHLLGNHTYSHPDANRLTAEEFTQEIAKGDVETLKLMASRRPYRLYFRHPMTHTGDTAEKKAAIERFLAARGYTIAPHTVENSDFLFNVHYSRARRDGNAALIQRVRDAYLAHTVDVVAFAERISAQVFGRDDVPQTLLIHANDLHADLLDPLLAVFSARGYRFISLDAAMADPAYSTPDTHVNRSGPTWLYRWSRSLGQTISFAGDPEPPGWIRLVN